jgi:hypothetical protein
MYRFKYAIFCAHCTKYGVFALVYIIQWPLTIEVNWAYSIEVHKDSGELIFWPFFWLKQPKNSVL